MLLWPRSFDAEGAACSCLGSRNACDKRHCDSLLQKARNRGKNIDML